MMLTVADLRRYCNELPDDAPVFIEYPARYGVGMINGKPIEPTLLWAGTHDEADVIHACTVARTTKKGEEALYILHHY